MKVLYEKESLRLLGAQIVGGEGVDKPLMYWQRPFAQK